jgi:hypothetical protein
MAASEDDLRAALEQRFKGDRSGACIAAAVIENGTTARAYFCANSLLKNLEMESFRILVGRCWGGGGVGCNFLAWCWVHPDAGLAKRQ